MENQQRNFPDDSIRRFLLGQLNASERAIFEEQLFTDAELEIRVRLAEYELADDYAFNRLPANETQSFRERYLLVAERRQKLRVSQALRDRFAPAAVRDPTTSRWQRLTSRLDLRRPAWRYGFAALVLVLILATVFLVAKDPQIVKVIIPHRPKPKPQATAPPQEMNHPPKTSPPAHSEQKVPQMPHETPLIVSLKANGSVESSAPVSLPAGENAKLRFHLSLPGAETGVHRADVLTTSGEKLFTAERLSPYGANPSLVDFDVPAHLLKSGQYQINLTRIDDQAKPEMFQYFFRVQ